MIGPPLTQLHMRKKTSNSRHICITQHDPKTWRLSMRISAHWKKTCYESGWL